MYPGRALPPADFKLSHYRRPGGRRSEQPLEALERAARDAGRRCTTG